MHYAHSSKLGQISVLWDTKTQILRFKHSDSIIQLVLSPKGAPVNRIGSLNTAQGPPQGPEVAIPNFQQNLQIIFNCPEYMPSRPKNNYLLTF